MRCITIFSDASRCHQTGATGAAAWARTDAQRASWSDAFVSTSSHEAEIRGAALAVVECLKQLPEPCDLVVLVVDCLAVKTAFDDPRSKMRLSPEARSALAQARASATARRCKIKVNHVKGHSGTGSPRQWVNNFVDKAARRQMRQLREQLLVQAPA